MSNPLPNGWVTTHIGDSAQVIGGLTKNSKRDLLPCRRPFLRVANVYANRLDLDDVHTVGVDQSELKRSSLVPGDLLVVEGNGSPDQIGRVALWNGAIPDAVHQNHIIKIRLPDPQMGPYLLWWMLSPQGRGAIKDVASSTSGLFTLSISKIEELAFPFPPFKEQQRIVAALDERLSELDASVASLERAERNLVRYRAAVLAAACSGKLVPTEADIAPARASRPRPQGKTSERSHAAPGGVGGPPAQATYESADQLLARILVERRKANTKAKYEEPAKPDISKLPTLPEGWVWASVEQLSHMVTSGSRGWGDFYATTGVLFIRAQDIKTDALVLEGAARVQVPEKSEGTRTSVSNGDLLVTITGANVTKSAFVNCLTEAAYVSQHVALVKLVDSRAAPFLFISLLSPSHGRKNLLSWAYGAGKPGLSLEQVRSLVLPLPPLAEQHRIVAEVDRHLSRADALAASIAQAKRRAQRLRRAILTAAFQGRLVPQDPNDEPASVLLERIAMQRKHNAGTRDEHLRASGPRSRGKTAVAVAAVATGASSTKTSKRRGRPPGAKGKAKA